MEQPELRAADADRERVAEKLRTALNEGRLDLSEFDERLQAVYAAKTYAELAPITADLPGPVPVAQAQLAVPQPGAPVPLGAPVVPRKSGFARNAIAGWASTSMITTGIWAATSISSGHPSYFWPIWVIIPMGAAVVAKLIKGSDHEERERSEREQRRALRDEHRRERRD
ncbi:hypothetical protein Lfu02_18940 [Longispora fulva]|uniref:DUF1707 domain-containing protein n=1 Tax=Longispora fulva TaxID=619741 RepID=A0A8J7GXX6_9ACTN|nr:DUF1707 domain-containing protein [Longispora fulva]MBG6140101.1 hypothetical protein [Longispora fulva]GIG57522.1 hypothetical protein Lfu02_18940 [Longispora fulva]